MEIHWTCTENKEQQIYKESTEMNTTRKEETWKTKSNLEKECGSRDEGRRYNLVVDGENSIEQNKIESHCGSLVCSRTRRGLSK